MVSVIFSPGQAHASHIKFRHARKAQGHAVEESPFSAAFGERELVWQIVQCVGLIVTFDVTVWPIGEEPHANMFFLIYLAVPIVLTCVSFLFRSSRCCIR